MKVDDKKYCITSIKKTIMRMSDEELKAMSKDDANRVLNRKDKVKWVELHNATANLYFIKNDMIEDVPPAGWWY